MLMSKTVIVKLIFCLLLTCLFGWWGGRAVSRYLSQPLATDIGTTFGDNEFGIRFPKISFCPDVGYLQNDVIFKDCSDSYYKYFMPTLFQCFKNIKDFKIRPLMESLHISHDKVFELVQIWNGTSYVSLQGM